MNQPASSTIRFAAGLALAIAALAVMFHCRERMMFYRDQIELRRQEKNDLAQMRTDLQGHRSAYDWMTSQAEPDNSLVSLVNRTLPGIKNDLVLRETRAAGEGWMIRRYDVRLDRVSPVKLGEFLAACVNARPPLRLEELQVTSSRESGGELAAQLTLAEMNAPSLVSAP